MKKQFKHYASNFVSIFIPKDTNEEWKELRINKNKVQLVPSKLLN